MSNAIRSMLARQPSQLLSGRGKRKGVALCTQTYQIDTVVVSSTLSSLPLSLLECTYIFCPVHVLVMKPLKAGSPSQWAEKACQPKNVIYVHQKQRHHPTCMSRNGSDLHSANERGPGWFTLHHHDQSRVFILWRHSRCQQEEGGKI